jgi:hypothetical protein
MNLNMEIVTRRSLKLKKVITHRGGVAVTLLIHNWEVLGSTIGLLLLRQQPDCFIRLLAFDLILPLEF